MEFNIITTEWKGLAESKVTGTFDGKPFTLEFNLNENTGTVDGDFDDTERLQILTQWEMTLENERDWGYGE